MGKGGAKIIARRYKGKGQAPVDFRGFAGQRQWAQRG